MEPVLRITKALSDGNRLRVLVALMAYDELCVCQVTDMLKLATATVSRHMSVLYGAKLVQSRKDGRWVYYRLSSAFPPVLRKWLEESLSRAPEILGDLKTLKAIQACSAYESETALSTTDKPKCKCKK